MQVLCGNYPEVCFYKYGGMPLKGKITHEQALRILIGSVERSANRYKRYLSPPCLSPPYLHHPTQPSDISCLFCVSAWISMFASSFESIHLPKKSKEAACTKTTPPFTLSLTHLFPSQNFLGRCLTYMNAQDALRYIFSHWGDAAIAMHPMPNSLHPKDHLWARHARNVASHSG